MKHEVLAPGAVAFRHARPELIGQRKLLLKASAIHRVERWGGMEPGIIAINDQQNSVTRTPFSYRAVTGVAS